jgi:hypothetical protein
MPFYIHDGDKQYIVDAHFDTRSKVGDLVRIGMLTFFGIVIKAWNAEVRNASGFIESVPMRRVVFQNGSRDRANYSEDNLSIVLCANCLLPRSEHAKYMRCLFEPTRFTPWRKTDVLPNARRRLR